MAWIESHQALGQHPKTRQLATLLKVNLPTAVGHLHYFWWWGLDFAATGVIPNATPALVAHAAQWTRDPDRFWLAMIQSGFIDVNEDCVSIHDWWDYAGRLVAKRAANAERMRNARAANITRTSGARVSHVQGLPTVPTVPDQPAGSPRLASPARAPALEAGLPDEVRERLNRPPIDVRPAMGDASQAF